MQACNYAKGRNQRRNNANDSFGKGLHVLKDHVLNHLMTGRCPRKSLQLVTAEAPAFSPIIASIFKNVLHLKDLLTRMH